MFQMCELGSWDVACLWSRDLGLWAVITELRLKFPSRLGGSQEIAVINGGLCLRDLGDLRVGVKCLETASLGELVFIGCRGSDMLS